MLVIKLLQKQGSSVKTWQAGMRLEALDRKTPKLICVATVGKQTVRTYLNWVYVHPLPLSPFVYRTRRSWSCTRRGTPPPLDTWRHTQQQQKRLTWWICTSVTLSNRLSFQLRPTGVSHWSCHEGHVDRTVPVLQKKSLVTCTGLVGACDPRKGVHDTENVLAFYRIVWHIGWICQLRRYAWFYHFNALIWLVGRQEGIRLVKTAPAILRRTRRNVYRRERLRDWLNKNRRRSRISSSYCLFVCLFVC